MGQICWFQKSNSGEIARSRLKLLLISDKTHVNPGIVEAIKNDMIGVLSRYAEVDASALDIRLTRTHSAGASEAGRPMLCASFPIRCLTIKRNGECF